jgi:hypothetical protein
MAVNIGDAQISVTIDTSKIEQSLKQATDMIQGVLNNIKADLNLNLDKADFTRAKDSLDSIDKTAKEASTSVQTLGEHGAASVDKLMKFQVIQGVMQGVRQAFDDVKGFVLDTTKEFATSELATEKLKGGLERLGSGSYFQPLLKQADELHKITPFDDDDISNMQAMLTTFGATGDQIQQLTPKMLDLAAAFAQGGDTGMNLQQTAILIGKATGADMVGALQRVGVIMTDTQKAMFEAASGMERINIMSEILAQNSNITAEAFGKTLAGSIKIAENTFKDIKETIGKAFEPVIRSVIDIVKEISDVFQKLPTDVQALVGGIIAVSLAATALIPILIALDVELAGIPLIIGAVVVAMGGLYELLTNLDSIKSFITEILGGEEAVRKIEKAFSDLYDEASDLWSVISDELAVAFEQIRDEAVDVWKSFTDLFGGSENLLDILKSVASNGFEYLKNIVLTVIDSILRVIKVISDTIESNNKWLGSTQTTGSGLSDFKIIVDGAVKGIEIMISVVGRAIEVMFGLYNALVGLGSLNIYDAIFDQDKFQQNLDKFKLGIEQVRNAFTESSREKTGNEGDKVYGPQLNAPISQYKEEKKTGSSTSSTGSGSDKSGKESDPYKEENESLKVLMGNFEHLLKLKDDEIKRGEATLADRNEIVNTYLSELSAMQSNLSNKENQTKVEEKISELTTAQFEQIKKAGEEQKKLSDDVGKFIDKRTEKTLSGVAKETAEIDNAYKTMYDKIEKSAIDASEKEFLKRQLDVKKEEELRVQIIKFEENLDNELKVAQLRNADDIYNSEIQNINSKYDKEKKRITDTYAEGEKRSQLLHQNEIARIKDLEKVHTEGEQNILNMINAGFTASANTIKTMFKNVWVEVFGEAHSLFQIFIQEVYNALIELAATSLFKFILNTISGGIFGGAASAGGGMAGGGYTGDGPVDQIADFVHYKETVMNAMGSAFPFNRALVDLANQGIDLSQYLPVMPEINFPVIELPEGITSNSGGRNIVVNLGGVSAKVNALKLSGNDFDELVDNDLIPQISSGLKRIGKQYLDNQINN